MIKRILCIALSLVMLASLCACAETGKPNDPNSGKLIDIVEETDIKLVSGGSSDYKIVIPVQPNKSEAYAARELQFFIEEATGAQLEIISDDGLSFNENAKYLSLGDTSILRGSGLTVDYAQLNSDGFKIKTLGNTVIMSGARGNGTLYAAYGFLQRNFDYDYFAIDEWTILESDNVNLKKWMLPIFRRLTADG